MEADIKCSNLIHSMETRLRAACNASDAKIDNVAKVNVVVLMLNMDYACFNALFIGSYLP